ncbi:hypothetical protein ACFC1R_06195 [Kitasatospora sp. NPDC056138]|uniref:hypothetical protein n=1 Tax=Kitasatospora sp. NPDC056138 TaxID=3345724 RepID=UPI0035DFDEFB
MTEARGTGPVWSHEPPVSGTSQPDWAALAERHEHQVRRRRQIRVVTASAVAVTAVGGIVATVIQVSGSDHKSPNTAATAATSLHNGHSASADPDPTASGAASGESSSPFADASASADRARSAAPARSATAGPTAPAAGTSPAAPPVPAPASSGSPSPKSPPSKAAANPYSAGQLCGSGYKVIDSHSLGGASVYLLFNSATGTNCVATLADQIRGPVPMNATLTVQGGGAASDPGTFTEYAGPVTEHASNTCVKWGGSYQGNAWTSGWSHCG